MKTGEQTGHYAANNYWHFETPGLSFFPNSLPSHEPDEIMPHHSGVIVPECGVDNGVPREAVHVLLIELVQAVCGLQLQGAVHKQAG